ncbi:Glutamyl-tRNA synthetase class Ib archaeal/eukaryotic cytosolic [Penicillium coprophilum]|uniref:Glutamyl-tRNA synthetase class Ib archaeal/eukaryotic cytosolic n=1 Tax=Penicillium coprophilum TaxID=36646 RepID=UPI002394E40D|nr:Glutamyl-tRNA synthetase class Ib archaeal/eukaryotic cytosolic [Penicillium coprophilum]KAJ5170341.1 Glutamyl-tRNA synthetase class Ib archaeal/eukaryotic cytosolic [Penicillium coprophilum]
MTQFNLFVATRASQAALLPVVLIAFSINEARPSPIINISLEDTAQITEGEKPIIQFQAGDKTVTGTIPIIQALCGQFPFLVGKEAKVENEWISQLNSFDTLDFKSLDPVLQVDKASQYLPSPSVLPVGLFSFDTGHCTLGALRGNRVAAATIKRGAFVNLTRWYRFVEELCPWATSAVESLNAASRETRLARSREGASYNVALKNTESGVVTRFPPEPSGYLHIGHAKAALLNDYFAHEKYSGTLILRFDDTNPSKEKQEFQDVIVEDLALMGIQPDIVSYTSDYFDQLYDYCLQIIEIGKAYADDTDKETINKQRWDGIPSKRRNLSPQESLAHLEDMKKGTPEGLRWCIRAKISIDDNNKCLRDPVIYRCNPSTHHRTGNTWNIYPTYDFACPIVDSMEGVTHALRTSEYRDRSPQYQWMLDTLNLRAVQVWEFSRMNFIRTLLSKRKLTTLVERGVVWGWDDPRFPTIRGMLRRGMTIPALREFILKQGPSKNVTLFDWGLIWATNKKYIDQVSPRHTVIETEDIVKATVIGGPITPYTETRQKHVKNNALGGKMVAFSTSIVLEQVDAKTFNQDEEITLMNWGNAIVREVFTDDSTGKVKHLELELHTAGDVKKTEKKVTWLSTEGQTLVPVELVDFDYLITKDSLSKEDTLEDFLNFNTEFRVSGLADCNVSEVSAGDILQFDRKGFYRVDRAPAPGVPGVFFSIPSGKQN